MCDVCKSKINGMKRSKKTYRRRRSRVSGMKSSGFAVPKFDAAEHGAGFAMGLGGDTLVDHVTGGFLTDTTGRWIKTSAGLLAVFFQPNKKLQGAGLGVAANNLAALTINKDTNETLGDTIKKKLLPADDVAGLSGRPYYLDRANAPYQAVERRTRMRVAG